MAALKVAAFNHPEVDRLGAIVENIALCLDDPGRTVVLLGSVRLTRRCRARVIEIRRPERFRPRRISDPLGLPGDLDLADDSVDLVIAAGWHEFSAFFRWSLQEVVRVLKVGAPAILCLPSDGEKVFLAPAGPPPTAGALARRLLGRKHQPSAPGSVASPRSVLEELGADVEKLTIVSDRSVADVARVGANGGGRSARSLRGLPRMAIFCRKRDLSWRCDPLLQDRAALDAAMRRDYSGELQRLAELLSSRVQSMAPTLANPEFFGSTALLLSPHPDDELIGAGGTLTLMALAGADVTVLEMSNGWNAAVLSGAPPQIRRTIRLEEAGKVCSEMGVRLRAWDDVRDGGFDTDRLAGRLAELLERIKPRYIFVPFVADPHEDHAVANLILAKALRALSEAFEGEVLSYEVWTFCPANFVVETSAVADQKRRLMNHYRTALRTVNYSRVAQWFGAWHGYSALHRFAQAEAFFKQSAAEYLDMVDAAFQPASTAVAN